MPRSKARSQIAAAEARPTRCRRRPGRRPGRAAASTGRRAGVPAAWSASSRRWPATPPHIVPGSGRAADQARPSRLRCQAVLGRGQRLDEIEEHYQPPAIAGEELSHERGGPRHGLTDELFPQRREISGRAHLHAGIAHDDGRRVDREQRRGIAWSVRIRSGEASRKRRVESSRANPPCHNSSARGSRSISANSPCMGISRSKTTWVQIAGPNASGSGSAAPRSPPSPRH